MDVKFISQDNEVQKLYAKFGMVVPVGDLSTGKAPAIQPLPSTSTQTSVTAQFNVMSGADISALSYTVNDGEAVSITPAKGVVTITLTDLEYNSGPYEIEITAVNENGSTSASVETDLVHYTNWATPDEVLEGNKFIGEDGQEAVGTYVPESGGAQNYLELQYSESGWQIENGSFPFRGYLTLNINDLNIPEGGTYSGNTPKDCMTDMEFLQCYLDDQHSEYFTVDRVLDNWYDEPLQATNAFIGSNGTIISPCTAGYMEYNTDTDEEIIGYADIPCGQTNLTGDFEAYAVTHLDDGGTPIYEVVATGTYFIPATQACTQVTEP